MLKQFHKIKKKIFHNCEVALISHICFPITQVFHQHLNSLQPILEAHRTFKPHTRAISALAIAPSSQITLIKVLRQGYQKEDSRPVSNWHSIKLNRIALASLSMDTIYDITLAIYHNSTLYAYFKLVCYHQMNNCVNAYYKFWTPKAKISLLARKANCYKQRQSTPIRINFHFYSYVLWKFRSYIVA